MRVQLDALPTDNWQHFLRQRDLEQILAASPGPIDGPVLEIGCGDGYLTKLLRKRFDQVIPVDLSPRGRVDGVCVATAEMLPFRNNKFGFVFSSNVLEHVEDLQACLGELHRVTKPRALMVHTMPTAAWKALQFVLHPAHLLVHSVYPKITRNVKPTSDHSDTPREQRTSDSGQPTTRLLDRTLAALRPAIHGTAPTHLEEFRRFRVKWWVDQFSVNGFEVIKTESLYLHSPYQLSPYRALGIRESISRWGISSVAAYWLKKST